MDHRPLTPEAEALIQGYVEGELTPAECARLETLLESETGFVAAILGSLRMDAIVRGVISGSVLDQPMGDEPGVQLVRKWEKQRRRRIICRLAAAACLVLLAALAAFVFHAAKSPSSAPAGDSGATGSILREFWSDIPGAKVSDLTSSPGYPQNPTGRELLGQFEVTASQLQNYGARIRGCLHPTAHGEYIFWISSDDTGELWLSTDDNPANKRRICFVETWTPPRDWTFLPSQQSAPILLHAGGRYYIEALHKQGGAGVYLGVAWQIPGGEREIIPGRVLSSPSASDLTPPARALTQPVR